ncbi:hypothetical protein [Saccharothrix xinjiangensis]|uniref:Uncharacterized protein n=1 Tax=Saccharothrix xinjiangensis TaxID=204798 RepID=A0ABV9Y0X5_9PSEU
MTALRDWLDTPDDLVTLHETAGADPGRGSYTLVRFYRRGEHTFRVRIERNSYQRQSFAVAEVLTATREWSPVVDHDPSHWHDSTSLHGDKGTGTHSEPGFDTLRRLADTLAGQASLIVPA